MGMDANLLGSSRWEEFEGFKDEAINGSNLVIGHPVKDHKERIYGRWVAVTPEQHFCSCAPTRSGKGVSLIIPNLLLYRGSVICIDPKGENAWITAERRRELGQKTILLDPWGEVNRRYGAKAGKLETVARFNPLSILDPKSEHYAEDIGYLSDALIINQGKDPHWDDSARELVAGLIAYLIENPETRAEASLGRVRGLLTRPADVLRQIAEDAQEFGFESVACRKLGRFAVDNKEMNSIISTALTQTAFLDSETLAENLSASDFSFEDLLSGQEATIYLVLPVDKLQTFGRWLRLMVSIGIRTVARNTRKLPLPVLFMLDEFGTIGKLSAVEQAYGLMAGLQMVLWIFVQDFIQLKRDYPDSWETFIGNSQAMTFMSVMDQFTCEYVSKLLGTTTVERVSQYTADMRKGGFFRKPIPGYSRMADQVFSRSLAHPSEVRRFTRTLGFMISGYQPLDFDRIIYYEEPYFLLAARPDPHFPAMVEAQKHARAVLSLPNAAAAQAALEQQGYEVKIKRKGLLSKKAEVSVSAPGFKERTFESEEDLFAWARSSVKWIRMEMEALPTPNIIEAPKQSLADLLKDKVKSAAGTLSEMTNLQTALEKIGIKITRDESGKITVDMPDGKRMVFEKYVEFLTWAQKRIQSGLESAQAKAKEPKDAG